MNDTEYRALPGITATAIKAGATSMLAMRAAMQGVSKADSPAMRWGRLVHLAILEPSELPKRTAVWTEGRRAGKAWEAFCASLGDREHVTPDEMAELLATSAAVHANHDAHRLIEATAHEVLVKWMDATLGPCKARLDGVGKCGVLEIKTARNVAPRAFASQFFSMGYPLQLGWYGWAAEQIDGYESAQTHVVAVSNTPPIDCVVYRVPSLVLERGRAEAIAIARRYRVCEQLGVFPGVDEGNGVVDLEVPAWAGGDTVIIEEGASNE